MLAGRMHSLGPDQLRGYTDRPVGDHSSNYVGGVGPNRGALEGTAGPHRVSLERSGSGQSPYEVHDEYVTAATIDYFNRIGAARRSFESDEPFCLTVGLMMPHAPFVARKERFDYYRERITMPEISEEFSDDLHPFIQWWRRHTEIVSVTEEEILRSRAAYWALVSRVDDMIGQMLDAMRQNDLLDNTIIIYTSDHGDMLGEHSLWWKHTFYEHSARVPLIISWPEKLPQGQRNGHVVSSLDVAATMLDAGNAPSLPGSPGRSLIPIMTDSSAAWDDVIFSEYCSDQFCGDDGCYQRMMRSGQWKYVYYHGQPAQLFDLENDPHELINLADDPSHAERCEQFQAQVLDGWNPDAIKADMAFKKQQTNVLRDWARNTHPTEQYLWPLKPEMCFLD